MHRHLNRFFVICCLLSACDPRTQSDAVAGEDASVAAASEDERLLRTEIKRGLERDFNAVYLPIGKVTIMGGLSSQVELGNFKEKRFPTTYTNWLVEVQKLGLATLVQEKQSAMEEVMRMGAKTIDVTPTEKTIQMRDENLSSADWIGIRTGSCEVLQIVRSSPYKSDRLSQSEEYRLVLGTYRTDPLPSWKALYPDTGSGEFKFRAVLKLNPFTKRYVFQFADYGDPQEEGWKTQNVE